MTQSRSYPVGIFTAAMVGVLLLTAFGGARGLTFDSIWYDEWRSLVYIGKATVNDSAQMNGTLSRLVAESDALNPPAYYVLLSVWGTLVGADVLALRYFSVLLGVLTVAVIYRVGAQVYSRGVGLSAAAILGTMSMFMVFMHEMRTYALAMLIVMLHLWTYWRCIQPGARWWHYAAFVGVIGLALYAHYTAVLMLGGTFAYHLIFVRRKGFMVGLYVLAGMLLLPWLAVVLNSVALDNVQNRADTAMPVTQILESLLRMGTNEFVWLAGVPVLLALGRGRLVWLHVLLGLAAYLTLNALVPFACCRRYLMVMLPGFALLVALGITRHRWIAAGFVALWVGTGFYTGADLYYAHNVTNSPRWHYPYVQVREAVGGGLPLDERLIVMLPGGIAEWTHVGVAEHFFPGGNARVIDAFSSTPVESVMAEVVQTVNGSQRVWLAYKRPWPPPYNLEAVQRFLAFNYTDCGVVYETNDVLVHLYTTTTQGCTR